MRCLGNVVLRSLRGSLVVVIISKRDGPFPVYPTALYNVFKSKRPSVFLPLYIIVLVMIRKSDGPFPA